MAEANLDPSKCSSAGHATPAGVAPLPPPAAAFAHGGAAAADARASSTSTAGAIVGSMPDVLRLKPATVAAIADVIASTSAARPAAAATARRASRAGKAVRKPKRRPRIPRVRPTDGGDMTTNRPAAGPAITADEKATLLAMISHLRGLNGRAERAAAVRGFTARQVQLFSWYQKQCRRLRSGKADGIRCENDNGTGAANGSAAPHPAFAGSGPRVAAARRAAIARQLQLLVHASHCRDNRCKVEHCDTMKAVLGHMAGCQAGWACAHPHCASSRALIQHYSQCRAARCPICPGGLARDRAGGDGAGGDDERGSQ